MEKERRNEPIISGACTLRDLLSLQMGFSERYPTSSGAIPPRSALLRLMVEPLGVRFLTVYWTDFSLETQRAQIFQGSSRLWGEMVVANQANVFPSQWRNMRYSIPFSSPASTG